MMHTDTAVTTDKAKVIQYSHVHAVKLAFTLAVTEYIYQYGDFSSDSEYKVTKYDYPGAKGDALRFRDAFITYDSLNNKSVYGFKAFIGNDLNVKNKMIMFKAYVHSPEDPNVPMRSTAFNAHPDCDSVLYTQDSIVYNSLCNEMQVQGEEISVPVRFSTKVLDEAKYFQYSTCMTDTQIYSAYIKSYLDKYDLCSFTCRHEVQDKLFDVYFEDNFEFEDYPSKDASTEQIEMYNKVLVLLDEVIALGVDIHRM